MRGDKATLNNCVKLSDGKCYTVKHIWGQGQPNQLWAYELISCSDDEDDNDDGNDDGNKDEKLNVSMEQVKSWPGGAQYAVSMTNTSDSGMTDVKVTLKTDGSALNLWNMRISGNGNTKTLMLTSWKTSLNPGETHKFGFVLRSNYKPEIYAN